MHTDKEYPMGADISRRRPRGRQLAAEYKDGFDWFDDHDEVLAFARALVEGDTFVRQVDLLYFFEKPYKWSTERDAWILAGEPDSFDPSEDA